VLLELPTQVVAVVALVKALVMFLALVAQVSWS
jgi:hypothetical protein